MGAYLSEPVTAKHSEEHSSDTLVVGASSMQGWRVHQEDAHNTILGFDEGIQLFAVYDGHGGSEVAVYCAEKLPDFIQKSEAYSKGDLEEALKQAFLNFDKSLTEDESIATLRKLAFANESDAEDEEENVANLREEATMPIEDVIAKYQSDGGTPALRKLQSADGKLPLSPCLRRGGPSGSGASSGSGGSGQAGPSSSSSGEATGSSSNTAGASSAAASSDVSSSVSPKEETVTESAADSSSTAKKDEKPETIDTKEENIEKETSSNGSAESDSNSKPQVNGDIEHLKEEKNEKTSVDGDAVSSTTEPNALKNGDLEEAKPKGKGKAKDKTKSISKEESSDKKEEKSTGERTRPVRKILGLQLMQLLVNNQDISDSDDSEDEDDDNFEGKMESSEDDDEDGGEGGEDDDDEDDEMDDDEDCDETDSEDEEDDDGFSMVDNEEPGSGSGCTAVVALLRGRDLFVANAGDSRCVVSRNGKAIDMSLDHKPEDAPEMARILAAGGKVTVDGRVNGGLNLSRAIGDHAYKKTEGVPPTEQMITALPDVRTLRVDPSQDEFMVLACDGIWNFMSSQEVVDFVRTRLVEKKLKPVQICEELFDHCLSPDTMGDGTGCDNMTAVIIQFLPKLADEPSTLERETILESPISNEAARKAAADTDAEKDVEGKEEEGDNDCETTDDKKEEEGDDDCKTTDDKKEEEDDSCVAKKRLIESTEGEEDTLSPKQKKLKVDHEASESNGVQV